MINVSKLILGPPGCGKTTALLNQVQEEMSEGVHPSRIAYVSFTRKAAGEAVERAVQRFNSDRKDFPFFRTLHSLAYQQLGLSRQQVMGKAQYTAIGNALGLVFSDYMNWEEGIPLSARNGDQALYMVAMARATMRTLEQQFKSFMSGEIDWWQVKQFADTLDSFKRDTGMIDFPDMLDRFVDQCDAPDIDVAFIDEAQDLSLQQWRMVAHAVQRAKRIYIAGDDDQAIYRWSGADVDSFLSLSGERIVLDQSYRLPRRVHSLCSDLARRISHRFAKSWRARDEEGSVDYLANLDDIDWKSGTYLMLARNRFLLQRMEAVVRQAGIPYMIGNKSIVDPTAVEAIKTWERLRRGDQQFATDVRNVYSFMRSGDGYKRGNKQLKGVPDDRALTLDDLKQSHGLLREDIWHEALIGIPAEEREFYLAARRRGEKLSQTPRVHISTIHGAKGGEADHVILMSDMAARTYAEYQSTPDDEHRVAYVGASRARLSLSILQPTTLRAYSYR